MSGPGAYVGLGAGRRGPEAGPTTGRAFGMNCGTADMPAPCPDQGNARCIGASANASLSGN
eukprot:13129702-Alexandrium_andersonii.AAC.1